MKTKEYALYRGEQLLDIGTAEELAKTFNVKPETIRFYSRPTYKRRIAKTEARGRRLLSVPLEDEDE